MNRYLAELIGTFALVFAGTGAIIINDHTLKTNLEKSQRMQLEAARAGNAAQPQPQIAGSLSHVGIAISFGLVVMAMIYAFGGISGAHFNPAVTIGLAARGQFAFAHVGPYILAQCAGGLLASLTLFILFPQDTNLLGATMPLVSDASGHQLVDNNQRAFVMEVILTAFLMFTILGVTSGGEIKGLFAGVAVGGVVALDSLFAGPVCGASMNPARSLAPAVIASQFLSGGPQAISVLWIYFAGPIAGALFATSCWSLLQPATTNTEA